MLIANKHHLSKRTYTYQPYLLKISIIHLSFLMEAALADLLALSLTSTLVKFTSDGSAVSSVRSTRMSLTWS